MGVEKKSVDQEMGLELKQLGGKVLMQTCK